MAWLRETKVWRKTKLCYVDTDRQPYSLHKKRRYYSGTAKDVETRLDTSNYELDRPLPKEKNNERWIRWENNDSVCPIEVENI